ncbi:hypothetical protein V8B97DRAFT_2009148 [Scleroderma yunnanense]
MILRLIPSFPHRQITYDLNFPCVLPFPDLPLPAAWTAQSNILTSIFQLENVRNIHVFDKAVGLVARINEVEMDIPQKEITVSFIDGRTTKIIMKPDCVRMLDSVADDVMAFNEAEGHRSSLESTSVCGSTVSSTDDLQSLNASGSLKPHKSGKHKRQRSLLFSLISSLVPKALSSPPRPSSPKNVSTEPPQSPLPPLPGITVRVESPSPPLQQLFFPPTQKQIRFLRTRARATLLDAWRLHILSAFTPHMPPAGYIEWVLQSLAVKAHSELQELQNRSSSRQDPMWRARHGRSRSEGRNALDLGERNDVERRWRSPPPPPLSSPFNSEDGEDRVVYPRRDQANEWGVRIRSQSPDELDAYTFELRCGNQSLIDESFSMWDAQHDLYGDIWDEEDRFTFDMTSPGPYCMSDMNGSTTIGDESHVHFRDDFGSDCSHEDPHKLVDAAFHFSPPVAPSDVNEDDDSDESQPSPRTPEDDEELPLAVPSPVQSGIEAQEQSLFVSRTSSSRPRPRPRSFPSSEPTAPDPLSDAPHFPTASPITSHPPLTSFVTPIAAWSPKVRFKTKGPSTEQYITERLDYLRRVYSGLNLVRVRAQEEGWRLIRASVFGAPTGWIESDGDRALEMKAKRRAWSSGIKVAARYTGASCHTISPPTPSHGFGLEYSTEGRVWDGKISTTPIAAHNSCNTNSPPTRPPGLCPPHLKPRGPIVPTGLSLGKPMRSSPLSLYVLTADDLELRQGKHGALNLRCVPESLVFEKRGGPGTSFVSFPESPTRTVPESPTRLFPVCEEDGEDEWESEAVCLVVSSTTEFDHSQTFTTTFDATSPESNVGSKETISVSVVEVLEDAASAINTSEDVSLSSPVRMRTRTTSMYSPSTSSTSPTLPIFRPLTPPPSYRAAVGSEFGDVGASPTGDTATAQTEECKLDASSILLRPLSGLSISSAPSTPVTALMHHQQPCRPSLTSNAAYVPHSRSQSRSGPQQPRTRPRSVSLPAAFSLSLLAPPSLSGVKKRSNSPPPSSRLPERDYRECEDLSQAYLSPPPSPSGPIIFSPVLTPHEQQYPRYAHMAPVAHAPPGPVSTPGMASIGLSEMAKRKAQGKRVVSGPVMLGPSAMVGGKGRGNGIPGGLDESTVFEGRGGDAEDAGGCEVALELGRAEEGRVVW